MLTPEELTTWYPQFAGFTPAAVLDGYIEQANARFSDFGPDTDEARRLYAAHKLTLYQKAGSNGGSTETKIASKKVGEVQVTYASSTSLSTTFADLGETLYGLELLSLLKLHSFTKYVP